MTIYGRTFIYYLPVAAVVAIGATTDIKTPIRQHPIRFMLFFARHDLKRIYVD